MNKEEQALKEQSKKEDPSFESVIDENHGKNDNDYPPIDFSTFIFSMSTAARSQLGEIANPETGKFEEHLPMAKQTIDILSMLQEKTKGNLTDAESKLLDDILYSLRCGYVDKMKNR